MLFLLCFYLVFYFFLNLMDAFVMAYIVKLCQRWKITGGNNRNLNSNNYESLSLSFSVVLTWRMAFRWVAVHWTLRLVRVLVWSFRPTSPTVSAVSLSSTVPTPTSTFRPKLCPATRPLPATCKYFNNTFCIIQMQLHAAFYIMGLLS